MQVEPSVVIFPIGTNNTSQPRRSFEQDMRDFTSMIRVANEKFYRSQVQYGFQSLFLNYLLYNTSTLTEMDISEVDHVERIIRVTKNIPRLKETIFLL